MLSLESQFQQFPRERTFVQNITPKTREWYETGWMAFSRVRADSRGPSSPLITRSDLRRFVIQLRERGVKPVSCNARRTRSRSSLRQFLLEQRAESLRQTAVVRHER